MKENPLFSTIKWTRAANLKLAECILTLTITVLAFPEKAIGESSNMIIELTFSLKFEI